MKRSVLEIYALVVCFFTVVCFVVYLGMAVWSVVSLSAPEFTMNGLWWQQYQSDESYKEHLVGIYGRGTDKDNYVAPTGQALTDARAKAFGEQLATERHSAATELIHNIIILLINILVFVPHWRLASRARQSAG